MEKITYLEEKQGVSVNNL